MFAYVRTYLLALLVPSRFREEYQLEEASLSFALVLVEIGQHHRPAIGV